MKITGIWTDRADKHHTASGTINTTVDDARFFFNVVGSEIVDAVRFKVFVDDQEVYKGGTNLDADGQYTGVFDIPRPFRKVGTHALKIILLDADENKPNVELGIAAIGEYTVIFS